MGTEYQEKIDEIIKRLKLAIKTLTGAKNLSYSSKFCALIENAELDIELSLNDILELQNKK